MHLSDRSPASSVFGVTTPLGTPQKKPRELLIAAYGIRAPGAVALGTLRPSHTETI